jgi:cytidine deaminase
MYQQQLIFNYQVFASIDELKEDDALLLHKARAATDYAYAPYSKFHVGAAAHLQNEAIVTGSNQENASYPVGICAERVLLSSASSQYPGVGINTMAIACNNLNSISNKPAAPCGICRQTIHEYEERQQFPIRLLLSGMEGEVYLIDQSAALLPLGFGSADLK